MISTSDFRKGTKILYKDQPYMVVEFQHVKPGKGGAFMRTKMKNMITGLMHEDTFRSGEKFDSPKLEYRDMVYLYEDGGLYQFMDQDNYEQVAFTKEQLGDTFDYLKEQTVYNILNFQEKPIAVNAPLHMVLKVVETPPGVRGDTAQGAGSKPATLETGLVVQVPLFVNEGDMVKVDTRDGNYIERVQK
ncbi:MAG: elongation factor P [Candidatus Dependentiae bacterium]|nr:elongation factor P [Candidatus Dependentiae bacterium]